MTPPVKQTRRYDSTRRRAQAEATRREILEAAERLFAEQGYGPTTMAAIAKEAKVALKTVYLAFETKSGLLRALWNLRLRGDAEEVPVGDRDWYREVLEEPDPVRALKLNARNSRTIKERFGRLHPVVRGAASVDADVDGMLQRIQTEFYENQRTVVESLAKKKALRKGLDVTHAADILWTLNHPDVWHHLVFDRGWTPEQYEEWFAEASARELLA
jgi:AcrR family transcriptional regulator